MTLIFLPATLQIWVQQLFGRILFIICAGWHAGSSQGLGVKRWFLMVLLGITMLGVGLALFLLEIYRTNSSNNLFLSILFYASLQFFTPRAAHIYFCRRSAPAW